MEQILIKGYPHLKGSDVLQYLRNEDFFSLHVGDKVSQIGDGRNNSTHRTLYIKPYMTYAGVYCSPDENEKYYCFLLPKNGVSGWNIFNPEQPVYSCFVDVGNKLIGLQNFSKKVCFCYISDFELVKD